MYHSPEDDKDPPSIVMMVQDSVANNVPLFMSERRSTRFIQAFAQESCNVDSPQRKPGQAPYKGQHSTPIDLQSVSNASLNNI